MAPIRYSLHYEDYSEHLMSRFGKLLQMQSLVDMTLMCSSHTLRVHKAVLAASSAYFQEVLQKQTGEPLIILKMKFNVLKCLVEFMYCGKTQCLEENLDELVSAAQFLKIKGLSKVTKEGLGINNHSELPIFTPPVVVNRPPQSLIDLHSQDNSESKTTQISNINQLPDNRTNKDAIVRIPFDIEGGNTGTDYSDPSRGIRPRRGRPSFKRPNTWEGGNSIGRAAERALMRREQDSRKAIHHLKHLQTKHMQDYMDRVTLSEAVNSICNNDSSSNYLNMDNDLMFMDQSMSSNPLDSISYSKDSLENDTMTSAYTTAPNNTANENANNEMNTAMSQYVNALKSAGLPTDLPILFESGDGSYINVNEQVLLDMVQSNEIQYEVIEQPNIIEKVADPSEIKSIDELSRSIERGEMLSSKNYHSNNNFDKSNNIHEETINSLNEILPDNLEPFDSQQNYVVLNQSLQNSNNAIDQDVTHDFSSIDSDMQFFTKSMSDDVKKFYEEQQLNESRTLDQFCPNTSIETSFNMSLLDTKSHYNSDVLKRNESCYDFSLQLPNANDFKEDTLDCLMSTPKHTQNQENYVETNIDNSLQEQDEIMKDLMNIENKIMQNCDDDIIGQNSPQKRTDTLKFKSEISSTEKVSNSNENFDTNVSNEFHWEEFASVQQISKNEKSTKPNTELDTPKSKCPISIENMTKSNNLSTEMDVISKENSINKENESPNTQNVRSTLDEDIPFAVGLLPLKHAQADESLLKRRNTYSIDTLNEVDTKHLKRKTKSKK